MSIITVETKLTPKYLMKLTKFELAGEYLDLVDVYTALQKKYNELLYGVAHKYPNESRHDTALRYIREREENKGTNINAKEVK